MDIETLITLVMICLAMQLGLLISVVLLTIAVKNHTSAINDTNSSLRAHNLAFEGLCATGDENAKAIGGIVVGLETRARLLRLRRDEDLARVGKIDGTQDGLRFAMKIVIRLVRYPHLGLTKDEIKRLMDIGMLEVKPEEKGGESDGDPN